MKKLVGQVQAGDIRALAQLRVKLESDPASRAELVGKAANGDVAAFEVLFTIHYAWSVNLVMKFGYQKADAEDIAQAGWMSAWRFLSQLKDRAKFLAWLRRILLNGTLTRTRKPDVMAIARSIHGVDGTLSVDPPASATSQPNDRDFRKEDLELVFRIWVQEALETLTDVQRIVCEAFVQGVTVAQIAPMLELSRPRVYAIRLEAVTKLKKHLADWVALSEVEVQRALAHTVGGRSTRFLALLKRFLTGNDDGHAARTKL